MPKGASHQEVEFSLTRGSTRACVRAAIFGPLMTPITKAMPKKRIGSARACDWPSPAKLQAPKPPLLIPNPKSLLSLDSGPIAPATNLVHWRYWEQRALSLQQSGNGLLQKEPRTSAEHPQSRQCLHADSFLGEVLRLASSNSAESSKRGWKCCLLDEPLPASKKLHADAPR